MPLDPFFTSSQKVNLSPRPPWVKYKKKRKTKRIFRGNVVWNGDPRCEESRKVGKRKHFKGIYRRI